MIEKNSALHAKLEALLGREIEIWTLENVEPWVGTLREVHNDVVTIRIDELETNIVASKIIAFRLSEEEQEE